jgi:phytoene dehydrogenase-like protein
MPSLLDPSLAPPGRHVIHAYTAGNEPYDIWARFKTDRKNPEYEKLKEVSGKPLECDTAVVALGGERSAPRRVCAFVQHSIAAVV